MALSDMKVFDEYIMPATMETLGQMIDKFNASSGGTIRLVTVGFDGDFMRESFFTTLEGARRRVDRYAANAAQAATPLAEEQVNGVKVAGGFGPISYEPSQMTWLQRPTVQGVEKASSAFAEILIQDQLNTAIAGAVAAIENNAAVVNDAAAAGIDYGALNSAHAKFGDSSSQIRANVMDGAVAHRLIGQNLANAERLFASNGVQVIDILGKAVVITDAPALSDATSNKVLGLVEGGVTIYDPSDVIPNVETSNGKQRIETTFQADYSFGVAIRGYSWDTATGGKSPNDAAIATGANWAKVVTNDKHTAGVLAKGNK